MYVYLLIHTKYRLWVYIRIMDTCPANKFLPIMLYAVSLRHQDAIKILKRIPVVVPDVQIRAAKIFRI